MKSGRGLADKLIVNRTFGFSIGLHMISFVRAFEESFRTVVFDALGGKRLGRLLGKRTRRGLVLPRPVPGHSPPRLDPLVVCPGFWFDKLCHVVVMSQRGPISIFGPIFKVKNELKIRISG